jgi:hypothetical protein
MLGKATTEVMRLYRITYFLNFCVTSLIYVPPLQDDAGGVCGWLVLTPESLDSIIPQASFSPKNISEYD